MVVDITIEMASTTIHDLTRLLNTLHNDAQRLDAVKSWDASFHDVDWKLAGPLIEAFTTSQGRCEVITYLHGLIPLHTNASVLLNYVHEHDRPKLQKLFTPRVQVSVTDKGNTIVVGNGCSAAIGTDAQVFIFGGNEAAVAIGPNAKVFDFRK